MEITKTFTTTSSKKYLQTRTVSIPTYFYDSVDRYDKVIITVFAGYGQAITITSSYTDLRQRCVKKKARGNEFYVLPY